METLGHGLLLTLESVLSMLWTIFWALALGFSLSGIVAAFVPSSKLKKVLGRPGLGGIAAATFLGAISSSCSFAAASTARGLYRKGAHFTTAMAFMLASTNLVAELSAVLWSLMGWRFVAAEFAGGVVMIAIMTPLMAIWGPGASNPGASGKQEHQHEHGPKLDEGASFFSVNGWIIAGQVFVSEVKMIWKDIFLGLMISAVLMVWVPDGVWRRLFTGDDNTLIGSVSLFHTVINALLGPLVSVLSFTCSVGNAPMAAVLYQKGIGFAGTLSFIYADLLIIPLLLIYRKYYGWKTALRIFGVFYVSMAAAALLINELFLVLGWIPRADTEMPMVMPAKHASIFGPSNFVLNHTFWLNLIFGAGAIALVVLSKKGNAEETRECCH